MTAIPPTFFAPGVPARSKASFGALAASASADLSSARIISAAALRRLLQATLQVVAPDPDLPAPLNAVLLAQAADGSWTATTTDAVSLATMTLPLKSTPDTMDADHPRIGVAPVIWMLHPDDAGMLLAVLTAADPVDLFDPISITPTPDTSPPSLSITLAKRGLPFTIRLIPNLTGYPDWRRLFDATASSAHALSDIAVASIPVHSFTAALATARHPRTVALVLHPATARPGHSAGQSPAAAEQQATPRVAPIAAMLAITPGDTPPAPAENVAITLTAIPTSRPVPTPLGHYDPVRLLAALDGAAVILPAVDPVVLAQLPSQRPDVVPTSPLHLSVADPVSGSCALWLIAPCDPSKAA